jgi:hypothetical protein
MRKEKSTTGLVRVATLVGTQINHEPTFKLAATNETCARQTTWREPRLLADGQRLGPQEKEAVSSRVYQMYRSAQRYSDPLSGGCLEVEDI